MKIVYVCFVSNGFDDHFIKLVCASLGAKEFLAAVGREYWKASAGIADAAGPYVLAVDLETMHVKPLGLFQLFRDGKLYAHVGRGEYSGKAETPEELEMEVARAMSE